MTKAIRVKYAGSVRRFVPADTTAKRKYNHAKERYEYSWIEGITENEGKDVWVKTTGASSKPGVSSVDLFERKINGVEEWYLRYHLTPDAARRAKQFVDQHSFKGVYWLDAQDKALAQHILDKKQKELPYLNKGTYGTGSKDAAQAPTWGYLLTPKKVPFLNLRHRIDNYVGPVYMQALPLAEFLRGNGNTPWVPSKADVTINLPCGLARQLSCFGVKAVSGSRKAQYKEAALNKCLDAAFRPRELFPKEQLAKALSLDPLADEEGNEWIPTSGNPLDVMSREEEYITRKRDAQIELDRIKKAIGEEKYTLLCLAAEGLDSKEIAERLGKTEGSAPAIRQALARIRKQLKEVA